MTATTTTTTIAPAAAAPLAAPASAAPASPATAPRSAPLILNQAAGPNWAMFHGDCCEVIRGVPTESVGYSVFSLPFSSLFTYTNSERDLGNCGGDEEFWTHFRFLIPDLLRSLKTGRLCSVHCMNLPSTKQHNGYIGLRDFRGDIIREFEKCGFVYHSEVVIWKCPVVAVTRTKALGLLHKQLVKDSSRCRQGIPDTVLNFAKVGKIAEIEAANGRHGVAGAEATKGAGAVGVPSGVDDSLPRDSASLLLDLWARLHPSTIVTFRKDGESKEPVAGRLDHWAGDDSFRHHGDLSIDIWQKYASPVWSDIDQTNVLQYRHAKDDQDEKHICPLQLDCIERCLQLWSMPGDVVLSPFAGIGSEGYVSLLLGRKFLGIELKESYWKAACGHLRTAEAKAKEMENKLF